MAYKCFGQLLTTFVAGWEEYEMARAYCLVQSISRYIYISGIFLAVHTLIGKVYQVYPENYVLYLDTQSFIHTCLSILSGIQSPTLLLLALDWRTVWTRCFVPHQPPSPGTRKIFVSSIASHSSSPPALIRSTVTGWHRSWSPGPSHSRLVCYIS